MSTVRLIRYEVEKANRARKASEVQSAIPWHQIA
jgi:hypothetical protein